MHSFLDFVKAQEIEPIIGQLFHISCLSVISIDFSFKCSQKPKTKNHIKSVEAHCHPGVTL
jgi:hypothetical protein